MLPCQLHFDYGTEECSFSAQCEGLNNKKATVQKCTVAKKTQKVETLNGLQAHFEKVWFFGYGQNVKSFEARSFL